MISIQNTACTRDMFLDQFLLIHPTPYPINDIILTLRVSSSVRSSISSLPLAIQMGPVPFDPSSSAQWEGTTQSMQLCPKDFGLALSPHCLCAEHTMGEGREGSSKWSQCWKHLYILLRGCSPCTLRRLHGRAELSCCPLSGYRQAACCPAQETTPPHAGDSISQTVVPLLFLFLFFFSF